jgi:hypothetical protein
MKIRNEIDKYSNEENKPVLHWLFDNYHMQSQWNFVARCEFERYGPGYYQVNRVWSPTKEGRALYAQLSGEI